jgi:hypothetical protein
MLRVVPKDFKDVQNPEAPEAAAIAKSKTVYVAINLFELAGSDGDDSVNSAFRESLANRHPALLAVARNGFPARGGMYHPLIEGFPDVRGIHLQFAADAFIRFFPGRLL